MDKSKNFILYDLVHDEGNETDKNLTYNTDGSDFYQVEIDKEFLLAAVYFADDVEISDESVKIASQVLSGYLVSIAKVAPSMAANIKTVRHIHRHDFGLTEFGMNISFSVSPSVRHSSSKFEVVTPSMNPEGDIILNIACQKNIALKFLGLYEYLINRKGINPEGLRVKKL